MELDDDTMQHIVRYAGRDALTRRNVTETVFEDYGDTEWTIDDFLSDINDAFAKIPTEFRASAKVDFDSGYDGGASLTISYSRQETDSEYAERMSGYLAYARDKTRTERRTYERLKAKFEGEGA